MPAIANAPRDRPDSIRGTVVVGPDAESRALGQRSRRAGSGLQSRGRAKDAPRRSFGRDRVCRSRPVRRSARFCWSTTSSRPAARLIACAKALAAAGATAIDAIVTHALFPPELVAEFVRAGIRSIRSTHSVPHPTNAIPLDDIFAAALRSS